jgi:hypothetical protein
MKTIFSNELKDKIINAIQVYKMNTDKELYINSCDHFLNEYRQEFREQLKRYRTNRTRLRQLKKDATSLNYPSGWEVLERNESWFKVNYQGWIIDFCSSTQSVMFSKSTDTSRPYIVRYDRDFKKYDKDLKKWLYNDLYYDRVTKHLNSQAIHQKLIEVFIKHYESIYPSDNLAEFILLNAVEL